MIDIYRDRIKPLFDKTGLMNKDLETEIGIPEKKISDWNAGRLKSYDKYIPQIASYFHVSTDYLLGNTDDPQPNKDMQDVAPLSFLDGEIKELVDIFYSLNQEGKTMLFGVARSLRSNPAYALNGMETKMAE